MRVALCHHYSLTHGGGGERVLADAASYLARRGHEVQIRCLPFRGGVETLHLDDGVEYYEKPLHRFEADVAYHIYAPLTPYLFRCKAPRIAGLHGAVVADYETDPVDFFRQGVFVAGAYLFRQVLGERALQEFDAIHTVNTNGLPVRHPRIFRIPNWVDCSKSNELLRVKKEKPRKFRVLFVGKRSYTKGFDRFVAISNMFNEDDIEFVATFSPGNAEFANQAKVRCVGHIPNDRIWELYATGGMLVHPTRKETFGLVILESLVSGTPVVTTPIPCHAVLKLPVQYASSLDGFASEVKSLYTLWKNDYNQYLHIAEEGVRAVRHYDRRFLLPQFEDMLTKVGNGGNIGVQ